jgi:hypothetical protein
MNAPSEYHAKIQAGARAAPGFRKLESKLLALGPGRVVPMPELHMAELLMRGAAVTGNVRVRHGEPNRCHYNAAVLWLRDPRAEIWTGYAYSGGVWRQHSWNVRDGEIIDMHDDAEKRFGVVPSEPEHFVVSAFTPEWDFSSLDRAAFVRAIGVRAASRFHEVVETSLRKLQGYGSAETSAPVGVPMKAGVHHKIK